MFEWLIIDVGMYVYFDLLCIYCKCVDLELNFGDRFNLINIFV